MSHVYLINAEGPLAGMGLEVSRWSGLLHAHPVEVVIRLAVYILALAAEGQLFVWQQQTAPDIALYVLVAVGFAAWAWTARDRWEGGPLAPVRWGWRRELPLVVAILAVAAFTRLYRIGDIPYGIEGDEAKWTVEAATLAVDGQRVLDAEYHSFWLPVSFAMQAPFHHLLGPSIRAARIAVACFSLLATVAFYWLVRQAVNTPVALIATFLLAVSVVDISASRLALVEAHVKLWAVLAPALALAAWQRRSTLLFLACGIVLALGLLTYETFAPMLGVVLVCVGAKAWSERADWRRWAEHLSALFLPLILVTPRFGTYLQGRAEYYTLPRRGLADPPLVGLARGLAEVLYNFYRQTTGDFLIVQSGPIIHPLLVPLLVIGLAYSLVHIRRHLLPVTWFLLVLIPVPVLLKAPYVRILYPGLPAMYMLIASALWGISWELGRQRARNQPSSVIRHPSFIVLALALVALGLSNWNSYLYEVQDPPDRQRRRELADLVGESVGAGAVVYGPYYSEVEDPLYAERALLRFIVRGQAGRDAPDRLLHLLPFDAALAELSLQGARDEPVAVLHDTFTPFHALERQAFAATLERCYPGAKRAAGRFFTVYRLGVDALAAPVCGGARVTWLTPQGAAFPAGRPVQLAWQIEGRAPTTARMLCERRVPGVARLEAEDFVRLGGWVEETRGAPDYGGRAFVVDDVTARAVFTATVEEAGEYRVWARWYRTAPGGPPALLGVGDRVFSFGTLGEVGRWVWEPVGSLALSEGTLALTLGRETPPGQPYVPLSVDALLLARDPAFHPERQEEWAGVADSGEQSVGPEAPYTYVFSGAPGSYRCRVRAFAGDWLVDGQGGRGAGSGWLYFSIR